MKNPRILLLFALVFLTACGQATRVNTLVPARAASTQAATPAATITATSAPTETQTLTPTPVPSDTPVPTIPVQDVADGVKTNGPYLIYARQIYDPTSDIQGEGNQKTTLVAMDMDGSGRTIFDLPSQGYLENLENAVSPNGEWVAYYTGSPEKPGAEGSYQFSLHLYQWRTGKDVKIADLLRSDYPENFKLTAKMLVDNDPKYWQGTDIVYGLQATFNSGIYRSAWSPDGRYLAYASEADGASSDLYLYSISTMETHRMSDGPGNIDQIRWTPDSEEIVHSSTYVPCEGGCSTYYVASIDGKTWRSAIGDSGWINVFVGWVSDHQVAVYGVGNGHHGPLHGVNIDTGEDIEYFEDGVGDAVYDPIDKTWLVSDADPVQERYKAGLYLVNAKTKAEKWISADECYQDYYLGGKDQQFLAFCGDNVAKIVHRDGTVSTMTVNEPVFVNSIQVSPDRHWFTMVDARVDHHNYSLSSDKIFVYDLTGNPPIELDGFSVTAVMWRPDSAGFYFLAPEQSLGTPCMYYFSLANHQVTQVDQGIQKATSIYDNWTHFWSR